MRTKSAVVLCGLSLFAGAFGPAVAAGSNTGPKAPSGDDAAGDLTLIDTVVVIYAENRSFDNLYGSFPGANGVSKAPSWTRIQRDRDGKAFRELPPVWEGLTAKGVTPPVTQA
jgi:phospholipase C